jgi:hypothetical protein
VSNYNLFYGKPCNQLTEEQLESLEEYSAKEGCLGSLNSCGVGLDGLLGLYPAFFFPSLLPISPGDKVIFAEDNWNRLSLYTALNIIEDINSLFNAESWEKTCSVKNTDLPIYQDFEQIWGLHEVGDFYYEGEIVFSISECGDAACAYIALQDIFDSPGINSDWKKIFCLSTEEYTCGGYRRKKTPGSGYRLIKAGPGRNQYVEHPIPYKKYVNNVLKNCGCTVLPLLQPVDPDAEIKKEKKKIPEKGYPYKEYLEDVFKDCVDKKCPVKPITVVNNLAIWFEGNLGREFLLGEEGGLEYNLNIHGLVIPGDGEEVNQPFLVSDPLPENAEFRQYLNYRPNINVLNENTLVVTWEYYKIPSGFKGKQLTIAGGG